MQTPARTISVLAPLLALVGGCIVEPPPPPPTTVQLANSTAFDVRPNLYTSGSATGEAGLFVGANLRTDFTDRPFPELRRNETATLTLECDEIQSLGVDAPVLFDAVTLTVTTSGDRIFLLRDTNFACGATIRFVYFTEGDAFRVRVELP
ncbi:MAG: hypothetical protein ACE5I3_04390 [Phycisphaerae bacterium]